ncbi:MAG TPA: methylated-DNA--[protein]-cysteine S-methyltransferase [Actinomycetota bacterium]|jgi:methylated-DNA-[protein]-cysteine S-methyltransferase
MTPTSDLETRLRRFDATVRRPALPDSDVCYTFADTPAGRLVLAATPEAVVACSYRPEDEVAQRLADAVSPRVVRSAARLDPLRRELDAYFAGRLRRFTVPSVPLLASPFTRDVLATLARVPYGETTTYGAVARAIGRPSAARAVGGALSANPLCIVLPCHRVLGSGGRLTGYAGGAEAKRLLLGLEAANR